MHPPRAYDPSKGSTSGATISARRDGILLGHAVDLASRCELGVAVDRPADPRLASCDDLGSATRHIAEAMDRLDPADAR
jgi:hypothetical protein